MATVDVDVQQLLIGGRWVGATSGRSFEKTNPFTGQAAGSAAAAGREDARAAVEAASQAFPAWAGAPPAQRRELLSAAAALLLERQEQLAAIVTEETGGTFGWGMFNCMLAAGMLREAAAQAYGSPARSSPQTCRASSRWAFASPQASSSASRRGTPP